MDVAHQAVARARDLIELRRLPDALLTLAPALEDESTRGEALCLKALAELRQGHAGAALESARAAAVAAPEYEWPHRLQAVALGQRGRHRAALAAASEAARLGPEVPEVLHVLAVAQWDMTRHKAALGTARLLLEKNPHLPLAHQTMGRILAGNGRRKHLVRAEEHYREALRIEPTNTDAALALAEVLRRRRRRQEAAEVLLAAGAQDPRDTEVRRRLARVGIPALATGGSLLLTYAVLVFGRPTFDALRSAGPATAGLVLGTCFLAGAGWTHHRRVSGTRHLPASVHGGLGGDRVNALLCWSLALGLTSAVLAGWAYARHEPVVGLTLTTVGILGVVAPALLWRGPRPRWLPDPRRRRW